MWCWQCCCSLIQHHSYTWPVISWTKPTFRTFNWLSWHFCTTYRTPGMHLSSEACHTHDEIPIQQPMCRVAEVVKDSINCVINCRLEQNIIWPSSSPWSSPVVMVRKKDGSWCFCIDYRKLNSITHRDAYPVPRIDATLDSLTGCHYFTTLDLAAGYWQVGLEEGDKEKTASKRRLHLPPVKAALNLMLCHSDLPMSQQHVSTSWNVLLLVLLMSSVWSILMTSLFLAPPSQPTWSISAMFLLLYARQTCSWNCWNTLLNRRKCSTWGT